MLETFTFVSNKEEVIYNNSFNENMPFNKTESYVAPLWSVRPDAGVKSIPIFSKRCPKSIHNNLT